MTTRRAKRHESDVFLDIKARKFWKTFDQEGLMHKDIRKFADRPRKFRKRAYHRAKEIENKSLKTEPLGLLRFVKAPFDPDPFEPFWATKEGQHDN
jgi:hypothetical protein